MKYIDLINYGGMIITFCLGYTYHKKEKAIKNFIRTTWYYLKGYNDNKKTYNEFFDCEFSNKDFERGDSSHDE